MFIPKTYLTRNEAELDKGILAANKIRSIIIADDEGGMAPYLLSATGFVKLSVSEKDYKRACGILHIK